MKKLLFVLALFCFSAILYSETVIYFGQDDDQIGVDRGEEEIWKPLFFDVDIDSTIHIPDFYKGRIAVFNKSGDLIKKIKVSEGISPRMNYFSLNSNGTYTTYDRYTLYVLKSNGDVLWKMSMGLGAIPTRIYTDDRGIFLKFSGSDYYHFKYSSQNKFSRVKDILFEGKTRIEDAMLIYQDKDKDIWATNEKFKQVIVIKNGEEPKELSVPNNGISGSGYWIVYGRDNSVYYVLYTTESLSINKL